METITSQFRILSFFFIASALALLTNVSYTAADNIANVPWDRPKPVSCFGLSLQALLSCKTQNSFAINPKVINVASKIRGYDFRPNALRVTCGNTNLTSIPVNNFTCTTCQNGVALGVPESTCTPSLTAPFYINCMTPDSSSPSIKVDIQTRRADQPDSAYVTLTGAVDGWLSDDKVRLKVTATDAGDSPVSIGTATGYTCTLNDGRALKLDTLTGAVSITRTDGCPKASSVSSFFFNNTIINDTSAQPYNLKLGTNTLVLITNCKQFDTVRMDFKDLNRSSWNFYNLSKKVGEVASKKLYSLSRSIYCVKNTPTIRSFSGAGIKNFFYSTDNLTYTGISFSGTTLSGVTLYDSTIEFYFDLPTVAGKTMENVYTYYFKVEDAALVSADNNQSLLLSSGNTSPTAFVEVKVDRTPPVSIAPESSWRKSLSDFGTGTTQSGTLIVADIYRRDEIFGTVVSIIRVNPVTFSGRSYNIVQSEDLPPLDWGDQEELPQLVNRLYKCRGDFSSWSHKRLKEFSNPTSFPQIANVLSGASNVHDGQGNRLNPQLLTSIVGSMVYVDWNGDRYVTLTCQKPLGQSDKCDEDEDFISQSYDELCGIECEEGYSMTAAGNCVVTTKTGSCGPLPMTALVYKNNFSTIDKVFTFTSRTLSGITYTGAAWSSPIHESGSFIQRFDREVDDYAPSLSSCTLDCGPGMHIEWSGSDRKCVNNMRTYCCAIGPLQIPNTAAGTTTSAVDTMPVAECGNRPIESFLEEWTSDIGWGEHAIFWALEFTGSTAFQDAMDSVCGTANVNIANSDWQMCDNGYVLSGSIADPRCVRVGTGFYAVGATFVYDSSGTPSMPLNGWRQSCSIPANATASGPGLWAPSSCPFTCNTNYVKNSSGTACQKWLTRTWSCSISLSGGYVYANGLTSQVITQTRSDINKDWSPSLSSSLVPSFDRNSDEKCHYARNPADVDCGELPNNAQAMSGTTYPSSWNASLSSYAPSYSWHYSSNQEYCAFVCKSGFDWDSNRRRCKDD